MRDSDLQHDVVAELSWDPSIDAGRIVVMVDAGVVTLAGWVHSCAEKSASERISRRVSGVRMVVNALDVRLVIGDARSDVAIARLASDVLAWNCAVPEGQVHIGVERAWITLCGDVNWEYQRRAAEDAVRNLTGVRGITNDIVVAPRMHADNVKSKIEAAFRRNAELAGAALEVEAADDGNVRIRGRVPSWLAREDVMNTAWAAPGVRAVEDEMVVSDGDE